MKTASLTPDKITVPAFVQRPVTPNDDEFLRKSIEEGGIQQPLVVVEDEEGRMLLADGLRRRRIAIALGIRVPVVIDHPPKGMSAEEYVRQLRFILDHHRQDLLPTQKADLVLVLRERFGLMLKQVALYLGVDVDSITLWLAVKGYIAPVREAIDGGRLTMSNARVFAGMTEEGQTAIWGKHERELTVARSPQIHKTLRAMYPPDKFANYYVAPNLVSERMAKSKKLRKGKARSSFTPEDKNRLFHSVELRERELEDLGKEQKQMKAEIRAAIAPIGAILRNKELWALVPEEMQEELARFGEVYV